MSNSKRVYLDFADDIYDIIKEEAKKNNTTITKYVMRSFIERLWFDLRNKEENE